ncbi:hypothetical protein FXO38_26400 [Capsicum annuum]|nr:hypothetical protein FXO38_26400 [Capsicum annuum]KAF3634082.1 hypothetical protein FXO37_26677 [Capsicum annuum]
MLLGLGGYAVEPIWTRHWCGRQCRIRLRFGQMNSKTLTNIKKKVGFIVEREKSTIVIVVVVLRMEKIEGRYCCCRRKGCHHRNFNVSLGKKASMGKKTLMGKKRKWALVTLMLGESYGDCSSGSSKPDGGVGLFEIHQQQWLLSSENDTVALE